MKFKLRQLLFDRNMNQAELHRRTKIRSNTITAYYHGYIKRMNVEDIEKICDVLGCTSAELIEYIPDEEK